MADYDAAIQAAGGLDLVILGLGERGHVAFNEPGAGFGEKTHIAKLAEVTREAAAPAFGSLEQTPEQGSRSASIRFSAAKKVVLVAFGARARKAVNATHHRSPGDIYPRVIPAAAHGC